MVDECEGAKLKDEVKMKWGLEIRDYEKTDRIREVGMYEGHSPYFYPGGDRYNLSLFHRPMTAEKKFGAKLFGDPVEFKAYDSETKLGGTMDEFNELLAKLPRDSAGVLLSNVLWEGSFPPRKGYPFSSVSLPDLLGTSWNIFSSDTPATLPAHYWIELIPQSGPSLAKEIGVEIHPETWIEIKDENLTPGRFTPDLKEILMATAKVESHPEWGVRRDSIKWKVYTAKAERFEEAKATGKWDRTWEGAGSEILVEWDGRDAAGEIMEEGRYLFKAEAWAVTLAGKKLWADPAFSTGAELYKIEAMELVTPTDGWEYDLHYSDKLPLKADRGEGSKIERAYFAAVLGDKGGKPEMILMGSCGFGEQKTCGLEWKPGSMEEEQRILELVGLNGGILLVEVRLYDANPLKVDARLHDSAAVNFKHDLITIGAPSEVDKYGDTINLWASKGAYHSPYESARFYLFGKEVGSCRFSTEYGGEKCSCAWKVPEYGNDFWKGVKWDEEGNIGILSATGIIGGKRIPASNTVKITFPYYMEVKSVLLKGNGSGVDLVISGIGFTRYMTLIFEGEAVKYFEPETVPVNVSVSTGSSSVDVTSSMIILHLPSDLVGKLAWLTNLKDNQAPTGYFNGTVEVTSGDLKSSKDIYMAAEWDLIADIPSEFNFKYDYDLKQVKNINSVSGYNKSNELPVEFVVDVLFPEEYGRYNKTKHFNLGINYCYSYYSDEVPQIQAKVKVTASSYYNDNKKEGNSTIVRHNYIYPTPIDSTSKNNDYDDFTQLGTSLVNFMITKILLKTACKTILVKAFPAIQTGLLLKWLISDAEKYAIGLAICNRLVDAADKYNMPTCGNDYIGYKTEYAWCKDARFGGTEGYNKYKIHAFILCYWSDCPDPDHICYSSYMDESPAFVCGY